MIERAELSEEAGNAGLVAQIDGPRHLHHPVLGPITLEYSALAVDGRPDLQMIVYNPATPVDQEQIRSLIERTSAIAAE
jgi:hypothetical protein